MKAKQVTPQKRKYRKRKDKMKKEPPASVETRARAREKQSKLESFGFPVVKDYNSFGTRKSSKKYKESSCSSSEAESPQVTPADKYKINPRKLFSDDKKETPKQKEEEEGSENKIRVKEELNDSVPTTSSNKPEESETPPPPVRIPKKRGRKPKSFYLNQSLALGTTSAKEEERVAKKVKATESEDSLEKFNLLDTPKLRKTAKIKNTENPYSRRAQSEKVKERLVPESSEEVNSSDAKPVEKQKEDYLITDRKEGDDFIPEVVIWGDQISKTIKEVSNFFIVGSRKPTVSPIYPNGNPNTSSESGLKKIINRPFTRRRGKSKGVQLMTLEEHKKILEACLRAPNGQACCDFKVDSLFRRGMETRRRSQAQPVYVDTVNTEDGGTMILETSTDPKSFSIAFENGHLVIDDVGHYESFDASAGKCSKSKCSDCDHQRRKRSTKLSIDPEGNWDPQCDEHGKPKCTYTDLIERALGENPHGLTVSEIYNWISCRFPYYSPTDDRWKNSVRHNLSINPYFKKGCKSKSGAGHVWTVSEECEYFRPTLRRHTFSTLDMSNMKTDTERAVASILGQYSKECKDEGQDDDMEDEESGVTYCMGDDTGNNKTTSGSNVSNGSFDGVTEGGDSGCVSNHLNTIDLCDLNSVMQSGCLLHMDDFSHNGQLIFITEGDGENDSNKENDDNSPVEYTILEGGSFIDSNYLSSGQVETQDISSSQIQESSMDTNEMRELAFNTSGPSIPSLSQIFDTDIAFQYENIGENTEI